MEEFEAFLAGRRFDPPTLALMKEAWNAALRAVEEFVTAQEGHNFGITGGLSIK